MTNFNFRKTGLPKTKLVIVKFFFFSFFIVFGRYNNRAREKKDILKADPRFTLNCFHETLGDIEAADRAKKAERDMKRKIVQKFVKR